MKKTIEVNEKHLEAALAVEWNVCTCILAQAVAEETGETVITCGRAVVNTNFPANKVYRFNPNQSNPIVRLFDRIHGEEKEIDLLPKLKSMLPATLEMEWEDEPSTT